MTESTDRHDVSATDYERYCAYEAEDGSLVLYDGDDDEAWVRSDTTVDVRP